MATIEETTKRGLCVSCGSCKAVCPTEAITCLFQDGIFVPSINKEKCINCSKCFEVCPGIEVNYTYLHKKYSDKIPSDFFKGNSIASYIVVTKNENILLNSSSGGFITSLIESLLAKKEYDSAFLLKYDDFDGLPAFLERVTDHKKVKEYSKSKYIPANIEKAIKYILTNRRNKVIMVLVPCHVHALLKLIEKEKLNRDNYFIIGLFCDKTLNYNFYEYYHKKYGSFNRLDYRNKEKKGWPGDTKLYFNEKSKFVSRYERMFLKDYFQLNRCRFCIDKFNQFADVSVGDCYIKGEEDFKGKSNIIIRTLKGKEIFESHKEIFNYKEIYSSQIYKSQKVEARMDNLDNCRLLDFNIYPNLALKNESKVNNDLLVRKNKEFISKNDLGKYLTDNNFKIISQRYKKTRITNYIKQIIKKLLFGGEKN